MKQPSGDSLWPGWWINNYPSTDGLGLEIDIMEGNGLNTGAFNIHHYPCPTVGPCDLNHTQREIPVRAATTSFHVYAVEVRTDRVIFFYDGKKVGEYVGTVLPRPRYLILGVGTQSTHVNSRRTLDVDYVRVWKRR